MRADIGLIGERTVQDALEQMCATRNLRAIWTRPVSKTHPFDFIVTDANANPKVLIEVKTFAHGRKHYWLQYKRPAIRRKRKWQEKHAPNAPIMTICVCLDSKNRPLWYGGIRGLPSCDIEYAKPVVVMLDEVTSA